MTRYIDADALIKSFDINIELTDIVEAKKVADAFNEIISRIKNTPTADVVEVVYCKDCKHYDELVCPLNTFEKFNGTGFCNRGERRE